MTRDIIEVQYPVCEGTDSVASVLIVKTDVSADNGITIQEVFSNKNNSLVIIVENEGASSLLTLKAGDAYPNSMLGDLVLTLESGVSAIQVQDISRFEKHDGSIDLDFASGFSGKIYAVAKWAGVRQVLG